jgi:hypothetical protein
VNVLDLVTKILVTGDVVLDVNIDWMGRQQSDRFRYEKQTGTKSSAELG